MLWFRRNVALVLLTLWLPATLHCDLEAAYLSFIGSSEHHTAACDDVCHNDNCQTIESAVWGKTVNDVKVMPPPTWLASCLLTVFATPVVEDCDPEVWQGDSPGLMALHRTWQFARRAAPPVRAPGCLA